MIPIQLFSNLSIVIMIGVDGLRADTLERMSVAHLQSLADAGVKANMIPAMLTDTNPIKEFLSGYFFNGIGMKHS